MSAIAIDASCNQFQLYSSGVFNCQTACNSQIDHAVMMIGKVKDTQNECGQGTDAYQWIIRNSWGTTWGREGYIYVCEGTTDKGTLLMFGYNMRVGTNGCSSSD